MVERRADAWVVSSVRTVERSSVGENVVGIVDIVVWCSLIRKFELLLWFEKWLSVFIVVCYVVWSIYRFCTLGVLGHDFVRRTIETLLGSIWLRVCEMGRHVAWNSQEVIAHFMYLEAGLMFGRAR